MTRKDKPLVVPLETRLIRLFSSDIIRRSKIKVWNDDLIKERGAVAF